MLVLRILAGCPTIFHSTSNIFYIFNAVGLYRVDLTNVELFVEQYRFYKAISPQYWCLVDCNRSVPNMPPFLSQSHAFIIQATPPRSERIDWVKKYGYRAPRYFMRNWPLGELIVIFRVRKLSVSCIALLITISGSILLPVCSIGTHGLCIRQQSG